MEWLNKLLEATGVGETQKKVETWFNLTAVTGIATTALTLILVLITLKKR